MASTMRCSLVTDKKKGEYILYEELKYFARAMVTSDELYDELISQGYFVNKKFMIHIVSTLAKDRIFLEW